MTQATMPTPEQMQQLEQEAALAAQNIGRKGCAWCVRCGKWKPFGTVNKSSKTCWQCSNKYYAGVVQGRIKKAHEAALKRNMVSLVKVDMAQKAGAPSHDELMYVTMKKFGGVEGVATELHRLATDTRTSNAKKVDILINLFKFAAKTQEAQAATRELRNMTEEELTLELERMISTGGLLSEAFRTADDVDTIDLPAEDEAQAQLPYYDEPIDAVEDEQPASETGGLE